MTLADKLTASRLVMAPFFFIVYFAPTWFGFNPIAAVVVLWLLFAVGELTDLLDGRVARARNEVSDFGKLFDPFSDTLVRITYFLCFVTDGILPLLLFVVVLYREFGILFMRTLMMRRGIAMGARGGGKLKAVMYMIAGVFALAAASVRLLSLSETWFSVLRWIAVGVFAFSVVLALLSFFDYYRVFRDASAGD